MLPGKHSSKVETRVFWQLKPRLRSTLADTLSASGNPPVPTFHDASDRENYPVPS